MRWLWPLAVSLAVVLAVGLSGGSGAVTSPLGGHRAKVQEQHSRLRRGTKDEGPKEVQHYVPEEWAEYPRLIHPAGSLPTKTLVATSPNPDKDGATPDSGQELRANLTGTPSQRLQIQNPLYPVTESSYSAYAVMLLALVVFAVGIVGNLSVMCIVWHSYYLKSAWNSILASLALWDFLVLFFCLPIVIFNEITKQRLLGDVSCRAVPFMEEGLKVMCPVPPNHQHHCQLAWLPRFLWTHLSRRNWHTMPRMSTSPRAFSCWQPMWVAMKQPVRPIPALDITREKTGMSQEPREQGDR